MSNELGATAKATAATAVATAQAPGVRRVATAKAPGPHRVDAKVMHIVALAKVLTQTEK